MTQTTTDAARRTGPATEEIHRTKAEITVDAPAELVYRTLTNVAGWPLLYPWIVHTEIVEQRGSEDLSKFWAVRPGPEGGLRIWQSRRRLHEDTLRMVFEQQGTVGAIRRLGGEWLFIALESGGCRVESHHWFTTDQDPAITAAELDRHGALQMRTLKAAVEGREQDGPLVLRAERRALLPGRVEDVHARLSAALGQDGTAEETAVFGTADTPHPDGCTGDGRTVHIGRAPHTIVVKHLDPPRGFALYRRSWRLAQEADGVRVTAERLAVARPETLAEDPGGERRAELLAWLGQGAEQDLPEGAGHLVG
ncbi:MULTISPECIES: SRPBCC family protein [unclassified Streptomyces]|uniref:SRPBCC family protein n=1 Tax=unclassified Streptomyces TaxID=2593676 RepID=UPI000691DBF5|nr:MULTISPECIES: SRPBCC family protein [unclassified Streptomyces]MCH0560423.1 SRPBCC family protein [Streptomyces sp. MUM 16J]